MPLPQIREPYLSSIKLVPQLGSRCSIRLAHLRSQLRLVICPSVWGLYPN